MRKFNLFDKVEFTEKKRKQYNSIPVAEKKGEANPRIFVNPEEIRTLLHTGMYLKDIAKRLGVSKTTIEKYIKKYDLRNGKK